MSRFSASHMVLVVILLLLMLLYGCSIGPQIAAPYELKAPQPILDNTGKYMCAYTQDGVLAEWSDKAINAKIGSAIGKTAGAYAGQKMMEQVPLIGGLLGEAVGEKVGRDIAIQASGGMQVIKNSSDISFNSFDDMAVYMYVNYSNHEHYKDALAAAFEIYPNFQETYYPALVRATNQQRVR